jgi:hypothetical protein
VLSQISNSLRASGPGQSRTATEMTLLQEP